MSNRRSTQRQPFSLDENQKDPVLQRRAKWVKPGKLDDEMVMREQYQTTQQTPGGKGRFGELVLDDNRFFDAIQDKKEKEEYLQYLKFGQQLLDPNDPLSQQRVFQVVPELKSLPEAQFDEDLALQEWLRILLRDGAILGPEDHKRMMDLMKPEKIIPMAPLWDQDGSFLAAVPYADKLTLNDVRVPFVSGEVIFNPTQWAVNSNKLDKHNINMIPVKVAMLKRVYPGCRAMWNQPPIYTRETLHGPGKGSYLPNPAINGITRLDEWYDEVFVVKKSIITNKATEDKFISWWKDVATGSKTLVELDAEKKAKEAEDARLAKQIQAKQDEETIEGNNLALGQV